MAHPRLLDALEADGGVNQTPALSSAGEKIGEKGRSRARAGHYEDSPAIDAENKPNGKYLALLGIIREEGQD